MKPHCKRGGGICLAAGTSGTKLRRVQAARTPAHTQSREPADQRGSAELQLCEQSETNSWASAPVPLRLQPNLTAYLIAGLKAPASTVSTSFLAAAPRGWL